MSVLQFCRKFRIVVLLFRVNETIQSLREYTPYASSRTFSHWRCINGRAECIAMHSHIIQEDIADSTKRRELVETKVRAHRTPVIDRQNFSNTKFRGCASYSNVPHDSNGYECTHASDANKLCSFRIVSTLSSKLRQM